MQMLQGFWKQHLRPRAVVAYGVKIFLPSPPNYVTRSPGGDGREALSSIKPSLSVAFFIFDDSWSEAGMFF